MPDMHNNGVQWSPVSALSARGLTVWRIRQECLQYSRFFKLVDFQLTELVQSFVELAGNGFDTVLVSVKLGRGFTAL